MLDLSKNPTIYITRDIERACGLNLDTPGYFIISNYTDFGNSIAKDRDNILLIKEEKQLDTWELLQHKETKKFIDKSPLEGGKGGVVVFKPTKQIERICAENNWNLLNPSAELSNKIEEKISQLEWLDKLTKYLPEHKSCLCKDIEPCKLFEPFGHFKPFILQFNRAHTGTGTILIESEKQLEKIKDKFPNREARITKYIEGPIFTNNNIVAENKILIGNINYQITGLEPFTNNKFATIGNDWNFPKKYLSEKQIEEYKKIVTNIGKKLKKDGWKGLFGVDVVIDKSSGKLYLIEINARQPASTTYESQLQLSSCQAELVSASSKQRTEVKKILKQVQDDKKITTFDAHLMNLLDMDLEDKELIEIGDGAQIILRNVECGMWNVEKIYKSLKDNFNLIKYNNTKINTDLLRIQSEESIIKDHNKLNNLGKKILSLIS